MKYLDNLDNLFNELKRTKKKSLKKKVIKKIQKYIETKNKACVKKTMDTLHKAVKIKDTDMDLIQYHNYLISGDLVKDALKEI